MLRNKRQKLKTEIRKMILPARLLTFSLCFLLSASSFLLCCFAQEEFTYDSKGKRNPFIPLVTADGRLLQLEKEEKKSILAIDGIIYDKHGISYAIVNGEVVKAGDYAGDYQVLKIDENKVTFIKDGETSEVEFHKEE